MGIDILPAELPVESSEFFSKALYPYIKEMVCLYFYALAFCAIIINCNPYSYRWKVLLIHL